MPPPRPPPPHQKGGDSLDSSWEQVEQDADGDAVEDEPARRSWLQDATAIVTVQVLRATGLKAADRSWMGHRSSDPYVKVSVGGMAPLRTATITKNLNPKWDSEVFKLLLRRGGATTIHFEVLDYDLGTSDDPLGTCDLDVAELDGRPGVDRTLAITDGNGLLTVRASVRHFDAVAVAAAIAQTPVTAAGDEMTARRLTPVFAKLKAVTTQKRRQVLSALCDRVTVAASRAGSKLKASSWRKVNLYGERPSGVKPCTLCSGAIVATRAFDGWTGKDGDDDSAYAIGPLTRQRDTYGAKTFWLCEDCHDWVSNPGIRSAGRVTALPPFWEALVNLYGPLILSMAGITDRLSEYDEQITQFLAAAHSKSEFDNLQLRFGQAQADLKAFMQVMSSHTKKMLRHAPPAGRSVRVRDAMSFAIKDSLRDAVGVEMRCKQKTSWAEELVQSEASIERAAERRARSTRIKGVLLVTVSTGPCGGLGARPVSVKLTAGDTLHETSQSTVERGHHLINEQFPFEVTSVSGFELAVSLNGVATAPIRFKLKRSDYETEAEAEAGGTVAVFADLRAAAPVAEHVAMLNDSGGKIGLKFEYQHFLPITRSTLASDPCALLGVNPGVVAGTPGVLFIGVHSAAGLPPMDRDGLADPYAKVKVVQTGANGTGGGASKLKRLFQTQVVDNTLDPVWDDAASCGDQEAGSWSGEMLIEDFSATTVHVKLMDRDGSRFVKDDIIGTVHLPVRAAPVFKTTVALPARKGKHAGTPSGSVCVTVIFRPVTVDAAKFVLNGVPPKVRGAGVRDVATQGLAMASGFMSMFKPLASRTPSAERAVTTGSKPSGPPTVAGNLVVTVHAARNLVPHKDARGRAVNLMMKADDFYVKVLVGSDKVFKTDVSWNSYNPSWEAESPPIAISDAVRQTVSVQIKVKGVLKSDVVATVTLDYATTHRRASRIWLPLGGRRGEIQLSVSFKT